jgi:hypothetical protein
MLYQPNTNSPSTQDFILNFQIGELADINGANLFAGPVIVRLEYRILAAVHLIMLGRLLQPFVGYFELVVDGSYTVAAGPPQYVEISADTILTCNIQPG